MSGSLTRSIFCLIGALLQSDCDNEDIINLRGRVNTIESEVDANEERLDSNMAIM
jgi:hypothetical protein